MKPKHVMKKYDAPPICILMENLVHHEAYKKILAISILKICFVGIG